MQINYQKQDMVSQVNPQDVDASGRVDTNRVEVANPDDLAVKSHLQLPDGITGGGDVSPPLVRSDSEELKDVAKKGAQDPDPFGGPTGDGLMGWILGLLAKVFDLLNKASQSAQRAYYTGVQAGFKSQMAAAQTTKEGASIVMGAAIAAGVVGGLGVAASGVSSMKSLSAAQDAHGAKIELNAMKDTTPPTEGLAAVSPGGNPNGVSRTDSEGIQAVDMSEQRDAKKLQIDSHMMRSEKHSSMAEMGKSITQTTTSLTQGIGDAEQKNKEAQKQEQDAETNLTQAYAQDQQTRHQKMQDLLGKAVSVSEAVIGSQREITRSANR